MSEGHVSHYTTVRGPDILHRPNVIVSDVTFYPNQEIIGKYINFHYCQNLFACRIWPAGCSL